MQRGIGIGQDGMGALVVFELTGRVIEGEINAIESRGKRQWKRMLGVLRGHTPEHLSGWVIYVLSVMTSETMEGGRHEG